MAFRVRVLTHSSSISIVAFWSFAFGLGGTPKVLPARVLICVPLCARPPVVTMGVSAMQHNVQQVHAARLSSIYYPALAIVPDTWDILMCFILVGALRRRYGFFDHRDHLRPFQCLLAEAVSKATIVPHMASLYDLHDGNLCSSAKQSQQFNKKQLPPQVPLETNRT